MEGSPILSYSANLVVHSLTLELGNLIINPTNMQFFKFTYDFATFILAIDTRGRAS